jgi:hypothetical protein
MNEIVDCGRMRASIKAQVYKILLDIFIISDFILYTMKLINCMFEMMDLVMYSTGFRIIYTFKCVCGCDVSKAILTF